MEGFSINNWVHNLHRIKLIWHSYLSSLRKERIITIIREAVIQDLWSTSFDIIFTSNKDKLGLWAHEDLQHHQWKMPLSTWQGYPKQLNVASLGMKMWILVLASFHLICYRTSLHQQQTWPVQKQWNQKAPEILKMHHVRSKSAAVNEI